MSNAEMLPPSGAWALVTCGGQCARAGLSERQISCKCGVRRRRGRQRQCVLLCRWEEARTLNTERHHMLPVENDDFHLFKICLLRSQEPYSHPLLYALAALLLVRETIGSTA